MTRYSIYTSISHICLIPYVYCHVSMYIYVRMFPCHLLMFNISQGITTDLLQLSINDSHHLLMLEGLSKVVHDSKGNKFVPLLSKVCRRMEVVLLY